MSIVELCIRTAATKAARPCRRIYPKGTQTFGRVPAFLRLFLFDAVKTNNLFLERNKNSNTCRSFLFRFAFRGARLSPILGRGDGAISLFLFRCVLFRGQTRCGRCKSRGRCGKSGLFSAENGGLFGQSPLLFSFPRAEGNAPCALRGEKCPLEGRSGGARRRFRAWGCIGEPIYKEGGALFGTETLCISRKALNSQLVKNTFGSACAHR